MNAGHKHLRSVTVATPRRTPVEVWMQVIDGELLGRMIKVKKHSQRQFAEMMGWKSHTYLQRLVRGKVRSVTPEAAALMCHYLEVPLDVLFETKVSTNSGRPDDENGRKKAS